MPTTQLRGSVLILILFDVCEEIRLDEVRRMLGLQAARREPSFKHQAPEYVRFENPPVEEATDKVRLASGEELEGRIKYYDYGVVSVELKLAFEGNWEKLVALSSRYIAGLEIERQAALLARQMLPRVSLAMVKPYEHWLNEDYYIFQVHEIEGHPVASELLQRFGEPIAQVVRGEEAQLSEGERREILQWSMSYSPTDLLVAGWNAAFVYDTPGGATTTVELLEYANSQLLEFRHYDDVLTRELKSVYLSLEKGTGLLARWRLARDAARLNALLLEVSELTERADNAIKFLSDMFSARLYRLAAGKVGVEDYKNLVKQKLDTAEKLYRFMVDQFHQGRAFVLELLVVVILIIEIVFLFKGKG